jgi:hypothetical protein
MALFGMQIRTFEQDTHGPEPTLVHRVFVLPPGRQGGGEQRIFAGHRRAGGRPGGPAAAVARRRGAAARVARGRLCVCSARVQEAAAGPGGAVLRPRGVRQDVPAWREGQRAGGGLPAVRAARRGGAEGVPAGAVVVPPGVLALLRWWLPPLPDEWFRGCGGRCRERCTGVSCSKRPWHVSPPRHDVPSVSLCSCGICSWRCSRTVRVAGRSRPLRAWQRPSSRSTPRRSRRRLRTLRLLGRRLQRRGPGRRGRKRTEHATGSRVRVRARRDGEWKLDRARWWHTPTGGRGGGGFRRRG